MLASAAVPTGLTVLALRLRITQPFWLVGWLWFLGMLHQIGSLATFDFGIDLAARTGHRNEGVALRLQRSAS